MLNPAGNQTPKSFYIIGQFPCRNSKAIRSYHNFSHKPQTDLSILGNDRR